MQQRHRPAGISDLHRQPVSDMHLYMSCSTYSLLDPNHSRIYRNPAALALQLLVLRLMFLLDLSREGEYEDEGFGWLRDHGEKLRLPAIRMRDSVPQRACIATSSSKPYTSPKQAWDVTSPALLAH